MVNIQKNLVRDLELIPIKSSLGRKFAYDIFPSEFQNITGDLSLVMLFDPEYLKAKFGDKQIAPMIRRGATMTQKIVKKLIYKKCNVVPVLIPGKPQSLSALSHFSRKQSLMLAGRVYSVVDNWLRRVRRDRAIGVIQAVKKYRTPLLQSLNYSLKDWEAVIVTLINDILVADENLTILSIVDDYIGDTEKAKKEKEHSLEVAVLALMLGRKCNLPVEDLKELGLAALIHDIGIVVYEQKLRELMEIGGQILDPLNIREIHKQHPVFGALLLSKRNGEPISGMTDKIREIVLEHEQDNNDTEPMVIDNEFVEDFKRMSIPEKVRYEGDNAVFPDSSCPKELVYPGDAGIKRFLSIPAQILHISEIYVTLLSHAKTKEIKNPHQKVIQKMLQIAGGSINGQIFEIFFNYLIPISYYPDNLIVKLYFKDTSKNKKYEKYNNHTGAIATVTDLSKQTRKMVHVVKTPDGKEVSPIVSFDLAYDKPHLYMRIDDWNKKQS